MKKLTFKISLVVLLLMLAACSSTATKPPESTVHSSHRILLASGYSQLQNLPHLSQIQNRLSVEQRAKLNAYRALAKQLFREKLSEKLSVAEQVIKAEPYRIEYGISYY